MDNTQNVNSTLIPINTLSDTNLLEKINAEKEDIEEDESANIITNRVITSKLKDIYKYHEVILLIKIYHSLKLQQI